MLVGLGISADKERANLPEVKYLQLSYYNSRVPVGNVEVKNMG